MTRINPKDFIPNLIPSKDKEDKFRWAVDREGNVITEARENSTFGGKKIEKVLQIMLDKLKLMDKDNLDADQIKQLGDLSKLINAKVTSYKAAHQSFFGKLYLLFSTILWGDVDTLNKEINNQLIFALLSKEQNMVLDQIFNGTPYSFDNIPVYEIDPTLETMKGPIMKCRPHDGTIHLTMKMGNPWGQTLYTLSILKSGKIYARYGHSSVIDRNVEADEHLRNLKQCLLGQSVKGFGGVNWHLVEANETTPKTQFSADELETLNQFFRDCPLSPNALPRMNWTEERSPNPDEMTYPIMEVQTTRGPAIFAKILNNNNSEKSVISIYRDDAGLWHLSGTDVQFTDKPDGIIIDKKGVVIVKNQEFAQYLLGRNTAFVFDNLTRPWRIDAESKPLI